ncbi:hypothetical protein EYF80_033613 [Liparis tanakae]|uniref:Uncharacterized protein n=1 Tax=Liparis tanakae TaxID=230148 RepID=A0A4Z2GR48_9TELE|nr:hypothetical protein EYF80_033613 [Liparis tanakae]
MRVAEEAEHHNHHSVSVRDKRRWCCPGTESEVTNMVQQRSRNTVPNREHSRLKMMDLKQRHAFTKHSSRSTF